MGVQFTGTTPFRYEMGRGEFGRSFWWKQLFLATANFVLQMNNHGPRIGNLFPTFHPFQARRYDSRAISIINPLQRETREGGTFLSNETSEYPTSLVQH